MDSNKLLDLGILDLMTQVKHLVVEQNVDEPCVYKQIKDIFDPQQILNPGVKAENAAKDLLKIIKNGR